MNPNIRHASVKIFGLKTERGFTLLEVLIAMLIITMTTLFIMGLFSQDSHMAGQTKSSAAAVFLAQEKMEDLLASDSALLAPVQSGNFSEPFKAYRYRVEITPYNPSVPDLKLITVEVDGPGGAASRLRALKRTQIIVLAAGGYHSLAVKDDGTVWSFGNDTFGQLGNNNHMASSPAPAPVCDPFGLAAQCPPFASAMSAAGGYYHSLVVKQDGTVWSFGRNLRGQLGEGGQGDRMIPVPVHNCDGCNQGSLSDVSAVSASAGDDFSLALKNDGTVWSWGDNQFGELGNNEIGPQAHRAAPVEVCQTAGMAPGSCDKTLTGIVAISAGGYHALALKNDGTVWAWGGDNFGQLGNNAGGAAQHSALPVQVCQTAGGSPGTCSSFLTNIVAVATGFNFSLALRSDGTVWAWGNNYLGYLGNNETGTETFKSVPVQVCAAPGSVPGKCGSYFSHVTAIAAGGYTSVALKSDGTVWTWGDNTFGQLGNNASGVTTFSSIPVAVCASPGSVPGTCGSQFRGATAIAAGLYHNLALMSNGSIWGWGNNAYGQLGNPSITAAQTIPVPATRF